jgi:addiction module HigA family antidote
VAAKRTRRPTHPGVILRETTFPALRLSVAEAARKLGVPPQSIHRIIARKNPRPVSPEMAVRIGKLCGNGPELWLNLQVDYDLWEAERRINTDNIPTLHTAK